ncbi:MAG: M20/M25/M40 family metallo-hydrolase [Planctomycetota bacterium]
MLIGVVFAVLGSYALMAGSPRPADADASLFSADRAFDHVMAIAHQPRPIGSAANAEARDYILGELKNLGIESRTQSVDAPDYFGSGERVEVVNIIGRIPGTESTRAVALMAHYDTVPGTPGANDNAAAVAALLETARALVSGAPVANDIVLLFTDGEEPAPRYGASALVADDSLMSTLGFVVNFEAVGGSGASLLVETSGPGGWVVAKYANAASRPAAFSVVAETVELMGGVGTDFDAFRDAGVPGLHFAYLGGSPIYHSLADDIASVSRRSLQHHGDHALTLAREYGGADLADLPGSGSSIFFTIGNVLVRYPAAWSLPLLALAVAAFGWALRGRAGDSHAVGAIVRTLGRMMVAGAVALAAGTATWLAITSARTTPSVVESYGYLALLSALCVVLAIWLTRRLVTSADSAVTGHAVVLLWLVLTVLTSIWLRGSSYIFLWPTLAASLSLGWTRNRWRLARFAFVAAPTILLSVPAIDVFFQLSLPRPGNTDSQLTAVVLVPLLLTLLATALLRSVWVAPGTFFSNSGPR